jgi:hypothetical protein
MPVELVHLTANCCDRLLETRSHWNKLPLVSKKEEEKKQEVTVHCFGSRFQIVCKESKVDRLSTHHHPYGHEQSLLM